MPMPRTSDILDFGSLLDLDELQRRNKEAQTDKDRQLQADPSALDWLTSTVPYGQKLGELGQGRYGPETFPGKATQALADMFTGQAGIDRRDADIQKKRFLADLPQGEQQTATIDDAITNALEAWGAGSFGGKLAKSADPAKFSLAKQLKAEGSSAMMAGALKDRMVMDSESAIARGRWSPEYKEKLNEARTELTEGRDYASMSALDRNKIQRQAQEWADAETGVSDIMQQRTAAEGLREFDVYERDWGEGRSRASQVELRRADLFAEKGLMADDIGDTIRGMETPFDRPMSEFLDTRKVLADDRIDASSLSARAPRRETKIGRHGAARPENILQDIDATGGTSVELFSGKKPRREGYMVASEPNTNTGLNAIMQDATPTDLMEYMQANKEYYAQPGKKMGAWKQGEDLYVEPSEQIMDYDDAMDFGRATDQIAGFDLNKYPEFEKTMNSKFPEAGLEFDIVPDEATLAAREAERVRSALDFLFNTQRTR